MSVEQIPQDVLRMQRAASDPAVSAWVAANAGCGKTHVLAQRAIRLLLRSVAPAKILCLTFTKAAAANMANQVFATLAKWVALDDEELDRSIAALEGGRPVPSIRTRGRRLFAEALDTPGGLKVQTIHAFCARLLQQFPFEADVAARFSVLEEFAQRDLLGRLRLQVLLEAAGAPHTRLGRALGDAITAAADKGFDAVVTDLIEKRDAVVAWVGRAGSIEAAIAELSEMLGIEPEAALAAIELAMMQSSNLPVADWNDIAALLATGSASECEQAARLRAAASMPGAARAEVYLSVFLTQKGEPRNRIVTRSFAADHPQLAARLDAEQIRLAHLVRRRRAVLARDRTAAALTIAEAVIRRYAREKENRGLLDFDDLIEKTLALLENVEAAWVHYKLDLGIDHVLIDEAQDTSPRQWEIIRRLAAEFTAGEGVHAPGSRSIFAVGDEKQSIFSFQGAAPEKFADMARHFAARHRDAELAFRHCKLQFSFRSGDNVLGAVDTVFARPAIFRSVTSDTDGIPPHIALPGKTPGIVEIWPPIEAVPAAEIEAWDAPFDEPAQSSPQVKLAQRIAATIRVLLGRGRSPGDVLVLVRQRGPLFEAIIRALKNAELPVAGADRLVLTEHIAVMDLLVLADVLLHEGDDLALATVLKSPLFGLDEQTLFALAWNRRGSLRAALRDSRDPPCIAAAAALERYTELAKREPPFGFYVRLLADGGRRRFLARLGTEAADALDELLNLALNYEQTEAPSLQGFVAFMRAAATEVKREMDIVRDEVRVMTVHGAKGLEAPVVILADTTTRPTGPRDPRILALARLGAPAGAPDCLVWAGAKDQDVPPMVAARQHARTQAEDEYRRLLYVAMTRAGEHLIVCGAHGANGKPTGCWYDLVRDALGDSAREEPALDGEGCVLRWRKVAEIVAAAQPSRRPGAEAIEIPAWLLRNVEPAPDPPQRLLPSRARNGIAPILQVETDLDRRALLRGRLAHRLLQSLPELPTQRRVAAARLYLARAAPEWEEPDRERLIAELSMVLDDPRLAALFAPGTRAEVPIRGRIARVARPPVVVSGQVDRLAVTDTSVLIADYKTDRPAPCEDVPPRYVRQLALYRAVLEQVYPGRTIRAALLWIDRLHLVEVPPPALEAALATELDA